MARTICLKIPEPPLGGPLSVSIPVIGKLQGPGDVTLKAYSACDDARSFIQGLQPALTSFSLPLCVLGCVTSITEVFKTSFPFIDPGALPNIVEKCSCLVSWTPFSFCGTLADLLAGISKLLGCILGLMSDITMLEARIAALSATNMEEELLNCLADQSATLRRTVQSSFEPFSAFFDGVEFLFSFVGIPFESLGSLTGDSTAEVVESLIGIQRTIETISDSINSICP